MRLRGGMDVEDGVWLFFDADGAPLEPIFLTSNVGGSFVLTSGRFSLHPATKSVSGSLQELLANVLSVDGELDSVDAVRMVLSGI